MARAGGRCEAPCPSPGAAVPMTPPRSTTCTGDPEGVPRCPQTLSRHVVGASAARAQCGWHGGMCYRWSIAAAGTSPGSCGPRDGQAQRPGTRPARRRPSCGQELGASLNGSVVGIQRRVRPQRSPLAPLSVFPAGRTSATNWTGRVGRLDDHAVRHHHATIPRVAWASFPVAGQVVLRGDVVTGADDRMFGHHWKLGLGHRRSHIRPSAADSRGT